MEEIGPEYLGVYPKNQTKGSEIALSEKAQFFVGDSTRETDWSKSKEIRIPTNESIFTSPTVLFSVFSLAVSIIFTFL